MSDLESSHDFDGSIINEEDEFEKSDSFNIEYEKNIIQKQKEIYQRQRRIDDLTRIIKKSK